MFFSEFEDVRLASKGQLFHCTFISNVFGPCKAEKLYCEEIDLGEEKPRQVQNQILEERALGSFQVNLHAMTT